MAVLTEEMKDLVKSGRCLVATAGRDGWPNIGPKGSVIVVDDSTLAFGEMTGRQSFKNLQENPRVAIAVVDYEKYNGYRFLGTAELETSGELYDKFAQRFAAMKLPKPAAAVRIKVEGIYSLSARNPGEKIA
jgi:predicted pyridoxine 5'-phosphate oxidase superfamily flavin-nucleotide-binding protein